MFFEPLAIVVPGDAATHTVTANVLGVEALRAEGDWSVHLPVGCGARLCPSSAERKRLLGAS